MIVQSPFFCSELSREASEQVFGTASIGDVWLLLEYPLSWERKAVEDSLLSSNVKVFLGNVIKAMSRTRILFIKTDRLRTTGISFYVVRSSERLPFAVRLQLRDYEQLMELDIPGIAAGKKTCGGELITTPVFLVCTHGRRDKCCAKYGYPLFKALHSSTKESIWQSSHVGGDRFAANLVCLPHGLFFAHVTKANAIEIVEEYREGKIKLDNFRGRACYSHPVQAAEFYLRSEIGICGVDDLRCLNVKTVEENRWRVEFLHLTDNTAYELELNTHPSNFQNFITCDGDSTRSVPQFVLNSCRAIRRHQH